VKEAGYAALMATGPYRIDILDHSIGVYTNQQVV
jgi:hypothetical protein